MDGHHSILFENSLMVVPKMHAEIGMDRVAPISEVTLLRFRIALTFLFFESLAYPGGVEPSSCGLPGPFLREGAW